jgi:hypothetical protein
MLPDRICRMVTALVDGELSVQQRKVVLRVLRRSKEARELFRELRSHSEQIRQLPRLTLPAGFADQVLELIDKPVIAPIRPRVPATSAAVPIPWGLAAAAAVLLAVGLGSYYCLSIIQHHGMGQAAVNGPESAPPSDGAQEALQGQVAVVPGEENGAAVNPSEELKKPAAELVSGTAGAKKDDANAPGPAEPSEAGTLASQMRKPTSLETAEPKLPLTLVWRELDEEKSRKDLGERLHKGTAQRIELASLQPFGAVEQLQAAYQAQGIRFLVDESAQNSLKLRIKQPDYAIFSENVSVHEVLAILLHLRTEDRKHEGAQRPSGHFDSLIVNGLSERELGNMAPWLSPRSAMLPAAHRAKRLPNLVDIRKPLSMATAALVEQALKGQGGPRPPAAKPSTRPLERLALVVIAGGNLHFRDSSSQVRYFREHRSERQPGTMQLLVVVRGKSKN